MTNHELADYVRSILDYDEYSGRLTWKRRSEQLFASPAAAATWNARFPGTQAGSVFTPPGKYTSYIKLRVMGRNCMAHRLAWLIVHGKFPEGVIDHVDGSGTNNRLTNLRDANRSENCMNARIYSKNTSGICGVRFAKEKGQWEARITSYLVRKRLGYFDNVFDAACARRSAEITLGFTERHGMQ